MLAKAELNSDLLTACILINETLVDVTNKLVFDSMKMVVWLKVYCYKMTICFTDNVEITKIKDEL